MSVLDLDTLVLISPLRLFSPYGTSKAKLVEEALRKLDHQIYNEGILLKRLGDLEFLKYVQTIDNKLFLTSRGQTKYEQDSRYVKGLVFYI